MLRAAILFAFLTTTSAQAFHLDLDESLFCAGDEAARLEYYEPRGWQSYGASGGSKFVIKSIEAAEWDGDKPYAVWSTDLGIYTGGCDVGAKPDMLSCSTVVGSITIHTESFRYVQTLAMPYLFDPKSWASLEIGTCSKV